MMDETVTVTAARILVLFGHGAAITGPQIARLLGRPVPPYRVLALLTEAGLLVCEGGVYRATQAPALTEAANQSHDSIPF